MRYQCQHIEKRKMGILRVRYTVDRAAFILKHDKKAFEFAGALHLEAK